MDRLLPRGSVKIADSGYQGWQKLQSNVFISIKRGKKRPLSKEDRIYNRKLASFRMRVEHAIRRIKVLRIISDTYRNFQKRHNLRFNIIAGIINMKLAS
jgi:hypothetical protein